MSKNTTFFIVETGNWKAKIPINVKLKDVGEYEYVEAATKALEIIFKYDHLIGDTCEFISLQNEEGVNYFDPEYNGKLEDVPDVVFGILTACYLLKDKDDPTVWKYYLSSELFENAAQPHNVELARQTEKQYSKQVMEFKKRQISLRDKVEIKKNRKK